MAGRTQSRGDCSYCGAAVARGGARRHLDACAARRAVIERAEANGGPRETLLHLRVVDENWGSFWLDLEMRGGATLKKLDEYLRAIWLECCGHLSRFSRGSWGADEISMRRRAADVFQRGAPVTHTYDFGDSSYTQVTLVTTREGVPTTRWPIALMVRNRLPEAPCAKCGEPATHLCLACLQGSDGVATFCAEHRKQHRHAHWPSPVPLVNSPRLGMCGYEGPAHDPFA